jgi:hypothetical protein
MAKDQTLLEIIDAVSMALNEARPYGLQSEVMASTIKAIRKDPELDISVAVSDALAEWDL